MKNLTRNEAIKLVGIEAVEKVENENCDYTNRLQPETDNYIEFVATVDCLIKGDESVLQAFYHPDKTSCEQCENLDELTWEIEYYVIFQ